MSVVFWLLLIILFIANFVINTILKIKKAKAEKDNNKTLDNTEVEDVDKSIDK